MKEYLRRVITGEDTGPMGVILKAFLRVLSWVYALAVASRRALYQGGVLEVYETDRPVISVGNITAGGVGKTPLVIFIAEFLRQRHVRCVVLTRGYMGRAKEVESDEARMMSERLNGTTIIVNPDRVEAAFEAEQRSLADIFLLDDGFQHWSLKRHLDLVAIDATDPFGSGYLLPRGILREPLSALARADLFVLTKTDMGHANVPDIRRKLATLNPGCAIVETVHAPVAVKDLFTGGRSMGLTSLQDRVVALCAIGSPDSFVHTLKAQGAQVERSFAFDDHHVFDSKDVDEVVRFCQVNKINKVITTHKDAVKLKGLAGGFSGISVLILEIDIKVTHGENELIARIDRLLHP